VLCQAEVVHRGGTIATAEGRLVAESSGKLLAHGTSTCLIMASNGSRNGDR
jgi:acyl-coenzyme A thioesterase PaaI-like protein